MWDPYIASIEKKFSIQPAAYDRHALDSRLKDIATRNKLNFCPVVDYLIQNRRAARSIFCRGMCIVIRRDISCRRKC